jgi:hypothetical protein
MLTAVLLYWFTTADGRLGVISILEHLVFATLVSFLLLYCFITADGLLLYLFTTADGRLVVISLLEHHVLATLVSFFLEGKGVSRPVGGGGWQMSVFALPSARRCSDADAGVGGGSSRKETQQSAGLRGAGGASGRGGRRKVFLVVFEDVVSEGCCCCWSGCTCSSSWICCTCCSADARNSAPRRRVAQVEGVLAVLTRAPRRRLALVRKRQLRRRRRRKRRKSTRGTLQKTLRQGWACARGVERRRPLFACLSGVARVGMV